MYDRNAAVEYAHRYAYGRNPKYYNFDGIGGDCTNFVSQVLAAGGAQQNYSPNGWYYNSLNDRAPSWTGVNEFYTFLTSRHSIGPTAREISINNVMLGDIIQLGNNRLGYHHSLVVVDTEKLLIACHTIDSDMRPLSTYSYDFMRVLHIDS